MSFIFANKPVATIKARSATSTDTYTINGVNAETTNATDAAIQINKILAIGDKEIAADEHMNINITKGAVEDE